MCRWERKCVSFSTIITEINRLGNTDWIVVPLLLPDMNWWSFIDDSSGGDMITDCSSLRILLFVVFVTLVSPFTKMCLWLKGIDEVNEWRCFISFVVSFCCGDKRKSTKHDQPNFYNNYFTIDIPTTEHCIESYSLTHPACTKPYTLPLSVFNVRLLLIQESLVVEEEAARRTEGATVLTITSLSP